MGNWLSIATGVYLLAMILYGHHRGFIRLAVSMVALIAALAIVHFSMPKVTEYLKENTNIQQTLSDTMKEAVGMNKANQSGQPDQSGEGQPGQDGQLGQSNQAQAKNAPSIQKSIIENLNLPQNIKSALIENNNNTVYDLLGVNAFTDYIGNYLADMILNSIGFVVLFVLVYIVIRLLVRWLDIIARLPILSGINKIAGALLGGIQGLFILWILCLLLTALSGTTLGMSLIRQVEASPWLSFLYNHNFLDALVISVIHGIF